MKAWMIVTIVILAMGALWLTPKLRRAWQKVVEHEDSNFYEVWVQAWVMYDSESASFHPDGFSVHLSLQDLKTFIHCNWENMPDVEALPPGVKIRYFRESGNPFRYPVCRRVYNLAKRKPYGYKGPDVSILKTPDSGTFVRS